MYFYPYPCSILISNLATDYILFSFEHNLSPKVTTWIRHKYTFHSFWGNERRKKQIFTTLEHNGNQAEAYKCLRKNVKDQKLHGWVIDHLPDGRGFVGNFCLFLLICSHAYRFQVLFFFQKNAHLKEGAFTLFFLSYS